MKPHTVLISVLMFWMLPGAGCRELEVKQQLEEMGYETVHRDTEWRRARRPYRIEKTLMIFPEATLTIGPGVEVLFGPKAGIRCQGQIIAKGTTERPVRFRGKNGATWDKIDCFGGRLEADGKPPVNLFEGCILEGGRGIVARAAAVNVLSSILRDNVSTPVRFEFSSGRIVGNLIHNNSTEQDAASGNGGGIMVYSDKEVWISDNQVYGNTSHGGRDGGGGIYAYAYDNGQVRVLGNRIFSILSDRGVSCCLTARSSRGRKRLQRPNPAA